jgi:hypothetical protein
MSSFSISIISICNQALLSLGATPIDDLSDGSVEAITCKAVWASARRALLAANNWSFARKRLSLAQDASQPAFEFQYQYTLPADLIRVVKVDHDYDYRVEGGKILTNSATCNIKYIFDNEDVTTWSDPFRDAMAARIRTDISYALTRSNTQIQTSNQILKEKIQAAKAHDGQQDYGDDFGQLPSSLLSVRG